MKTSYFNVPISAPICLPRRFLLAILGVMAAVMIFSQAEAQGVGHTGHTGHAASHGDHTQVHVAQPTKIELGVHHYDLTVTDKKVNMSGLQTVDFALVVNGTIPGPTLEFTEGETAEIAVQNSSKEETSIHWHGLLVPNNMDGVSHLTNAAIAPGETFVYRFQIRQSGTYWYHSHSGLQEQKGLFGPIVIHPQHESIHADVERVVMLSDWIDENPEHVASNLKKDGDYYQRKKGTVRSFFGAMQTGELDGYFSGLWMRMIGMDYSDIGYDAFLINGKKSLQLSGVNAGQTVRLRIINAGTSTYFRVRLGRQKFKVVAADGQMVEPTEAHELFMAMAESYDILVKLGEGKYYELRAVSQDGLGSASAWLGDPNGSPESPPPVVRPSLYQMNHAGHNSMGVDHAGHTSAGHEHETPAVHEDHSSHAPHADHTGNNDHASHVGHTGDTDHASHAGNHNAENMASPATQLNEVEVMDVTKLRALVPASALASSLVAPPTAPPAGLPVAPPRYEIKLELDGDMDRYVWFINGKTIAEDRFLDIQKGDRIRLTFQNNSMMHHPMHLHGHFFRVVDGFADNQLQYAPLKHTVDVGPYSARTIEFLANEPGQWMLHCHNLYHMATGMARIVRYKGFRSPYELTLEQSAVAPGKSAEEQALSAAQNAQTSATAEHLHRQPVAHDPNAIDPHAHDPWYRLSELSAFSNDVQTHLRLSQTRWQADAKFEYRHNFLRPDSAPNSSSNVGHDDGGLGEGDVLLRRWQDRYLNLFAGLTAFQGESRGAIGVRYLWPVMIETNLFLDTKGKLRLDFNRHINWTAHFFTDFEWIMRDGFNSEWLGTLMYAQNWNLSYGASATNDALGFGLQYHF